MLGGKSRRVEETNAFSTQSSLLTRVKSTYSSFLLPSLRYVVGNNDRDMIPPENGVSSRENKILEVPVKKGVTGFCFLPFGAKKAVSCVRKSL
jgi:hypothetical protein